MKLLLTISANVLLCATVIAQPFKSYQKIKEGVAIQLKDGLLQLKPLASNAIRVQFVKDSVQGLPELIYVPESIHIPAFTVLPNEKQIELKTAQMKVVFDKQNGSLTFFDKNGGLLLKEIPYSRFLKPSVTMGEPSYDAKISFESPTDEALFGLGQFQDGQFNIRNIPRDLLQLNTQISIPFYYSTKGYGLLWHQYGETRFNLPHDTIGMKEVIKNDSSSKTMDVTTDGGVKKIKVTSKTLIGSFSISQGGKYVFFLNYSNDERMHSLIIDGKQIIDHSNHMMPYASSAIIGLEAGNHTVEVVANKKG